MKKIDVMGTMSDVAADLADKMDEDAAKELPLVKLARPSARCSGVMLETPRRETITHGERISLTALVYWAASNNNLNETVIFECLNAEFGVQRLGDLPSGSYDAAIRYLVDFQKTLN